MTLSNEFKVGLLTLVAMVLFILGFGFLKGKDMFNTSDKIYAIFEKVTSLEKSNLVKLNGVVIGNVYEIAPKDKDVNGVVVTIKLTRDINIPVNSVAYIAPGLVSSSSLVIEKGDSKKILSIGDTILTRLDNGLFGDISTEIPPTLLKLRTTLDTMSILIGNVNSVLTQDAKANIHKAIANLSATTNSINGMLADLKSPLNKSINNAAEATNDFKAITANIKNNNDKINDLISNSQRFTQRLSNVPIETTVQQLQATIEQLKNSLTKLSSPTGSLGALMNDRQLYNRLNSTVLSAEILLDDLRTHPKRYVNISVFGRKDKGGALSSPTVKDTVAQIAP